MNTSHNLQESFPFWLGKVNWASIIHGRSGCRSWHTGAPIEKTKDRKIEIYIDDRRHVECGALIRNSQTVWILVLVCAIKASQIKIASEAAPWPFWRLDRSHFLVSPQKIKLIWREATSAGRGRFFCIWHGNLWVMCFVARYHIISKAVWSVGVNQNGRWCLNTKSNLSQNSKQKAGETMRTQLLQTLGSACWMAKTTCTLLGTTLQHCMIVHCLLIPLLVSAWNMHFHIVKICKTFATGR